jgi:hypothetical protein
VSGVLVDPAESSLLLYLEHDICAGLLAASHALRHNLPIRRLECSVQTPLSSETSGSCLVIRTEKALTSLCLAGPIIDPPSTVRFG